MANWIEEPKHSREFIDQGYTVVDVRSRPELVKIRTLLVKSLRAQIELPPTAADLGEEEFLNSFHRFVPMARMNEIRVKAHKDVGASEEFRKLVFELIQDKLNDLVGNEIVMQRQVNFVLQIPKDPTALLYLHTDVWAGCSPYEIILWMPLVDVYESKSMYICNREKSAQYFRRLQAGEKFESSIDLMETIRPDVKFLNMKFGEALLFSPILLHGAEENQFDETRVILNVRFKALFSPYKTKALGETFTPVNFRPVTRVGLDYESEFEK